MEVNTHAWQPSTVDIKIEWSDPEDPATRTPAVESTHGPGAEAIADRVLDETKFESLTVEGGAAVLRCVPPHDLVVAIAEALAASIDTHAPNYVETPMRLDPIPAGTPFEAQYALIVQRVSGKTPHQLRRQAEAERDEALERVAGLEDALRTALRRWKHAVGGQRPPTFAAAMASQLRLDINWDSAIPNPQATFDGGIFNYPNPMQAMIACNSCGTESGDYIASTQDDALTVARTDLNQHRWSCGPEGDFCPNCGQPDAVIEPKIFYMLTCLECEGELAIPFESPEARGEWSAAHTKGTGHDRWIILDVRTGGEKR
jgi:hypothetical protein